MDKSNLTNKRIQYIFIINALSLAVLSIRFQKMIFILSSVGILLFYSIVYKNPLSIGSLCISLTFLYTGPQIGWLYIRGAHVATYTAEEILDNGWPINATIRRSTPSTPLVHLHAILSSEITDLPISPSTNGELLITAFLPIIYSLVSLLMAFLIIRRYININERYPSQYFLFIPALIWAPFFWTKPAFNRQSIGFLFFISSAYILFRILKNNSWKLTVLALIFTISTILGHDFASISLILLMVAIYISVVWNRIVKNQFFATNTIYVLLPLTIVLFISWIIIGGFGVERISNAIIGITTDRLGSIISLLSNNGDQSPIPSEIGEPLEFTIFTIFQNLFSIFLYAFMIGVGITGYVFNNTLRDEDSVWAKSVFIFGLFIGFISIFSWITGTNAPDRVITYLVFVGGGIALLGYVQFENKLKKIPISNIVVIMLLCLSVSMIPLHIVSDSPPRYDQGETDQRFSKPLYATADFIFIYSDKNIYGDENVEHVVGGKTGRLVNSHPQIILTGDVPNNGILVLQNYNEEYYFGTSVKYGSVGFIPNGFGSVRRENNKLYSSGDVSIYS